MHSRLPHFRYSYGDNWNVKMGIKKLKIVVPTIDPHPAHG